MLWTSRFLSDHLLIYFLRVPGGLLLIIMLKLKIKTFVVISPPYPIIHAFTWTPASLQVPSLPRNHITGATKIASNTAMQLYSF